MRHTENETQTKVDAIFNELNALYNKNLLSADALIYLLQCNAQQYHFNAKTPFLATRAQMLNLN